MSWRSWQKCLKSRAKNGGCRRAALSRLAVPVLFSMASTELFSSKDLKVFGFVPRDTPWIPCWSWKGTLRPSGLQAASEWDGLALPNLQSGKQLPGTSGLGRAGAWGRADRVILQAAWRGSAGQSAKQCSKQSQAPQSENQASAQSSQSQH